MTLTLIEIYNIVNESYYSIPEDADDRAEFMFNKIHEELNKLEMK